MNEREPLGIYFHIFMTFRNLFPHFYAGKFMILYTVYTFMWMFNIYVWYQTSGDEIQKCLGVVGYLLGKIGKMIKNA